MNRPTKFKVGDKVYYVPDYARYPEGDPAENPDAIPGTVVAICAGFYYFQAEDEFERRGCLARNLYPRKV